MSAKRREKRTALERGFHIGRGCCNSWADKPHDKSCRVCPPAKKIKTKRKVRCVCPKTIKLNQGATYCFCFNAAIRREKGK